MTLYFDHNATTPTDPRVVEAMQPYLSGPFGNPSSLHRAGRAARDAIDAARAQVAALVDARPAQVVFTSGGTEADNLAVKGVAAAREGRIVIGGFEHPAVLEAARALATAGREVIEVPADADGVCDLDALRQAVADGETALVSVMIANNETGAIQPVAKISEIARSASALYHCDAVQAAGKLPVSFAESGADLMSLSSHKLYGPKGVGALIMHREVPLMPQLHGGGHEGGMRSGTENVAAIAGFGMAAELAAAELDSRRSHLLALRERFEAGLSEMQGVRIFGQHAERLPNTTQFSLPGYDGETLLMALDRQGMAVSSGSACASGKGEPSHVLLAMGIDAAVARGAVRVSFGKDNDESDVDRLLATLSSLAGGTSGAITNLAAMQG